MFATRRGLILDLELDSFESATVGRTRDALVELQMEHIDGERKSFLIDAAAARTVAGSVNT